MNLRVFMLYGSFGPLGSRELAGSCSPDPEREAEREPEHEHKE